MVMSNEALSVTTLNGKSNKSSWECNLNAFVIKLEPDIKHLLMLLLQSLD